MALLDVDAWPALREPILLFHLSGWVDGGMAGHGALEVVDEQLESRRQFGRIDLADLCDLQQTRPTVHLVDGATREIEWPELEIIGGHLGRDVVIVRGPEPSLRWRDVLGEIVGLAQRLGVTRAFSVGGIPTMASHRRPIQVLATATTPELVAEARAMRADYSGPTGAQTALQVLLGEAGIPCFGLWAQVPHYVAGGSCAPAIRALLVQARDLGGPAVDLTGLDEEVLGYMRRVDEGLAERPEVAEAIRAIESGVDDEMPSGDELASEIERFLRDQS